MSFDPQPVLAGALVSLRPLRPGDFAALFAVASDPLVWEQHPASDRYQEPVFREFFDGALKSGGALIVNSVADGAVIGSSRFSGWDAARSEVEIGWTFLARQCWGGRYNAELKALMLGHAFESFDSVVFNVGQNNVRSQKAVLKLGAREEARFVNGSGYPSIRYRLMRPLYDAVGGFEGLKRLAHAWHRRVLEDEVVAHAFSHGFHRDHTERLAAYWAEALGGPKLFSQKLGSESSVVRIHSGNGPHPEMDQRAIDCFDQAMDDVGIARGQPLRRALHDYFAWATTTTMARYHHTKDDVPRDLAIPKWSWNGLVES